MSEEALGEQFRNPKPVHASQLPWNTVRQAGAIHVGTEAQADSISSTTGWPITVKVGGQRRVFKAGGHDTHRLEWQPGVEHHNELLSDTQANLAHYHHSEMHGYPRGTSIDDSIDAEPGSSAMTLRPGTVVGRAVQALNEGKVVAYNNYHEGEGGTSHLVPDPHRMLRKRGEEPTPVHPTLFAAGQFAGGGPFKHAFSAKPEDISRSMVPGQVGHGVQSTYEPHLSGAPHRPLTFDEKTQQSRSATVRSMTKKPEREPLIHPDWKRAQGTLF